MNISEIISFLEKRSPPSLQESYDNAGLITGNSDWECRGILCSLDATEEVVTEAVKKNCNLIVAHHPIVFGGLKKINGKNYVEKTVIAAIKNDIAIYAIHTNLDNVVEGVNGKIGSLLGLQNMTILQPRDSQLKKLITFIPVGQTEKVREALFEAGAGHIGNYSECSFTTEGTGTFKGADGTDPFVGQPGSRHHEKENRLEMIFPSYLQGKMVTALKKAHPYEEVAFDIIQLANEHPGIGSGLWGELPVAETESGFLNRLRAVFGTPYVRHTVLTGKPIKKVALCGGAGSFLISKALAAGADAYITADLKYHEFFDANGKLLLCDIGHYESEQFTIELLGEILQQKFPTFAVLKTEVKTNPVYYYQ